MEGKKCPPPIIPMPNWKGVNHLKYVKFIIGLLLINLFISGCSSEKEPAIGVKDPQETSESENLKQDTKEDQTAKEKSNIEQTASTTSLTPPESMQLKEERDGITPQRIEIPSIKVDASIEKVGRLENGQMGVPEGFDTVGWFEPGIKPGAPGNAVMAGHVDSKTGPAVFYKLEDLTKGDEIIVMDKEGNTLTFEVTGKESYKRKNAPVDKIFDFAYTSKLNLITCVGNFNKKEGTHEERLVVYTELKETKK